ncbi:hypothetical protein ABLA30_01625 [Xenorhabdus nematophila]|uniref:hypothetical protein n=1 Tax=Xenorhabdus nematophila TaxID=628 RepID=UPI0032B84D60
MNIALFYLPFLYSCDTRFKTLLKITSWCFIYIVPLFFFVIIYNQDVKALDIFKFIASIFLVYNLYEVGYIYNDTETIKKEVKPTLRLSKYQMNYYKQNRKVIYSFRYILGFLLTIVLFRLNSDLWISISPWLIIGIYYIYNNIRNRFNLVLHFLLVTLRYALPVIITTSSNILTLVILIIFIFPLVNLIERCGEIRFNLSFFQTKLFKNHNKFRIFYYLFFSIIFGILLVISDNKSHEIFTLFVTLAYFLIYRTVSVLFLKMKGR